jgi:glycosyltransferase involved in cell wall biosynthesis
MVRKIELHDYQLNSQEHLLNTRYPYKVIRRLLKPNILYNIPIDLFSKTKADIYHGTNFTFLPIFKGKKIITIHDLAYMRYPETTSERIYAHHSKWVPYCAKHCDHIIADSQQTKNDIIDLLHISEDKISVVYLAANSHFKPIQKQFSINISHDPYFLFVGTLEPRKNLLTLLKAYVQYRKNSDFCNKLVLVGVKGWKYSPIFDWIKENKLEDDIIVTGFITEEELVAMYNGATALVMPSIYEGFGLPVVEAMQCGTPIIGSNCTSIAEIVDHYGILIDPYDIEGWARALDSLSRSQYERSRLAALSLERASHFSWKETAIQTHRIYERLL